FLTRTGEVYGNSLDSDYYLDETKPSYIGDFLDMVNLRLYPFWGNLTEALLTGKPQNETREGGQLFDSLYAKPDTRELFLTSMTGISRGIAKEIVSKFPFQNYSTFADIGCAQGGLSVEIAKTFSH